MPTEAALEVLDGLKWRYATKKFDPNKKIPQMQWNQIEEAMRLSPSSFGLQPYRFVVITDQKVKDELVGASWNQRQVADCSHLVVFCRLNEITPEYVGHFVEVAAETRQVSAQSMQGLKDMITGYVKNNSSTELSQWMAKQAYIALGNLMTVASTLHIDNCPMEGLNREEYDRILGLPAKGCNSVVMCALGYRAADCKYQDVPKVRMPADELFIRI